MEIIRMAGITQVLRNIAERNKVDRKHESDAKKASNSGCKSTPIGVFFVKSDD
jgi:hypothetical protein